MAETIGNTTTNQGTHHPYQHKSFFANGRFWVFWSDGTNIVYVSKPLGGSWSTPQTFYTMISASPPGHCFDVHFDGTYMHYFIVPDYGVSNRNAYYRRAVPESDGSFTWSAVEQTAVAASSNRQVRYPNISVDSDGYPWITYLWYRSGQSYNTFPRACNSTANDGTWVSGTTTQLNTVAGNSYYWRSAIVALTGGKMAVVFSRDATTDFRCRISLGSGSWLSVENLGHHVYPNRESWDIAAYGDDVFLVYNYYLPTYHQDIYFLKRDYASGWGSRKTVFWDVDSGDVAPTITALSEDELYVFYAPTADFYSKANWVMYLHSTDSGNTWGSRVQWVDETANGFPTPNTITVMEADQSDREGMIAALWLRNPAAYSVRFKWLVESGSRSLSAGFTVAQGIGNLKAGLRSVPYDYITVMSSEELHFDGKADYYSYLYKARNFSGPFHIKGEFEIISQELFGFMFFIAVDEVADSVMGSDEYDVAYCFAERQAGGYQVRCGASDEGVPDHGSPVSISLNTTYYYIFRRDGSNQLSLEVYSDPEFTVLVGTSSPANPHSSAYHYIIAVDGGGYNPIRNGYPRTEAYVRRIRVVI